MTIVFPRTDVFDGVSWSAGELELVERQEMGGREANGAQPAVSYGSGLWRGTYVTDIMHNRQAVDFQAVLNSLDGIIGSFEAWDMRRPGPRAYPDGSAGNGTLAAVNANNKAIALAGLNSGQIVARGDYLSFTYKGNRALHQAMETVAANSGGSTAQFEVRPHLRLGWTLDTAVNLKAPRGIFVLVKDSVEPRRVNGRIQSFAFQAAQYIKPGFYP